MVSYETALRAHTLISHQDVKALRFLYHSKLFDSLSHQHAQLF